MFRKKKTLYLSIKNHVLRYGIGENDIQHYGEVRLPTSVLEEGVVYDPNRFQSFVEDLVREYRLRRAGAVVQLLDQHVLVRTVEVPDFVSREELKGYIYSQLGETIHLPYEDPVIDLSPLEKTSSVLLFAYPSAYVHQLEDMLKRAKLYVTAADVSLLSIYRCYEEGRVPEKNEHLLFVDWNIDGVSVTAYHHDIPHFSRFMKSDLPVSVWSVEENGDGVSFQVKEEERVFLENYMDTQLSELSKLMNFYRYSVSTDQQPIMGVVLSGDFPVLEEVRHRAEQELRVPVDYLAGARLQNGIPFKYADVTGLTLRTRG